MTGGPVSYCSYCQGEGYQFTEEEICVFMADGTAPIFKPGVFGSGQYPLTQWGQADPSKSTGFTSWFYFQDYERYMYRTQKTHDKVLDLDLVFRGARLSPRRQSTAANNDLRMSEAAGSAVFPGFRQLAMAAVPATAIYCRE